MIGLPEFITLKNIREQIEERADVVSLERDVAVRLIDQVWWNEPWITKEWRRTQEDSHWRWAKFVGKFGNRLMVQRLAIKTCNGDIQGAIIFDANSQSFLISDQGAVYVEYIATAPRNRRTATNPFYNGVGTGLLAIAAYYSLKVGFQGRVVLEFLAGLRRILSRASWLSGDKSTSEWYGRYGVAGGRSS